MSDPTRDFNTRVRERIRARRLPWLAPVAIGAVANAANAAAQQTLVAAIKSPDDQVRGAAWQGAASAGPPALQPLAALMVDPDLEVARSAKRAMWIIVRHAGRPGAGEERKAAQAELVAVLKDPHPIVQKEALWMLSEVGDIEAIAPMAVLLSDSSVREDARCALLRLPSQEVAVCFEIAFKTAPESFKHALGEALRQYGKPVEGYPSQSLKPAKATKVGTPEGR